MARHPWLDPSAFHFRAGPIGVLLIHGFTGAPTEMRPLGEYLAVKGYTVSGPLLPGHGTTPRALMNRKWSEWAETVDQTYQELTASCDRVFVAGLSLGALLALNLAADQRESARPPVGLVLFSPAIFFANRLIHLSWVGYLAPIMFSQPSGGDDLLDPEADRRTWCYEQIPARAAHQVLQLNRRVRQLLPTITSPTLIVMSEGDASLKYESGPYVRDHIGATDKTLITLHKSGHNVLVDGERHLIMQETVDFMARILTSGAG